MMKFLRVVCKILTKIVIFNILYSVTDHSPHSAACVSIVLAGNFWEQIGQKTEEDLASSVQPEAWDSISDLKQVMLAIVVHKGKLGISRFS